MFVNPSKKKSLQELELFINNKQLKYSYLRNFDFGISSKSGTSFLSPYISHGILTEVEIIKKSLQKNSIEKIEKFIQEILWRIYWKGWLELRPDVWNDYNQYINDKKINYLDNENYLNAINGNTKIDCFNDWVNELKNNNYLHNHARMWFASIWIFTFKLPWQLGANFFLENLYDGDAASNTLGWRWVGGLQTVGKHYLAKSSNIQKYTNNKYQNIALNENALPLENKKQYILNNREFINTKLNEDSLLLIFENNLSFETSEFANKNFKKILIVDSMHEHINENVKKFKRTIIQDQLIRLKNLSIECEIININEIIYLKEKIHALYPCVGSNLDFIKNNKLDNINFLYRDIDKFSWKYCNKGFFNFKNYIPKIINQFIN